MRDSRVTRLNMSRAFPKKDDDRKEYCPGRDILLYHHGSEELKRGYYGASPCVSPLLLTGEGAIHIKPVEVEMKKHIVVPLNRINCADIASAIVSVNV